MWCYAGQQSVYLPTKFAFISALAGKSRREIGAECPRREEGEGSVVRCWCVRDRRKLVSVELGQSQREILFFPASSLTKDVFSIHSEFKSTAVITATETKTLTTDDSCTKGVGKEAVIPGAN